MKGDSEWDCQNLQHSSDHSDLESYFHFYCSGKVPWQKQFKRARVILAFSFTGDLVHCCRKHSSRSMKLVCHITLTTQKHRVNKMWNQDIQTYINLLQHYVSSSQALTPKCFMTFSKNTISFGPIILTLSLWRTFQTQSRLFGILIPKKYS